MRPNSDAYIFPDASELVTEEEEPKAAEEPPPGAGAGEARQEPEPPPPPAAPEEDPVSYAQIQAKAILEDAQRDAEAYKAQARLEFQAELEQERSAARQEGYAQGYAEGMAAASEEGKRQRDELAAEQVKAVQDFLASAAREKIQLLEDTREELKDLALAVAEKVIRISLKNSSDILQRMVDAATDTHKRCEWAHIYVADCDVRGRAQTIPELTAALRHVSNRVRVIPMADDESGTCIVELPDVILDASVSTQLSNVREVLENAGPDKGDEE